MKWMITGANGNLGRALVPRLLSNSADSVVCVVRSERALQQIEAIDMAASERARVEIKIVDYTDTAALQAAAQGCNVAVHLVGILKEDSRAKYVTAHEQSCTALVSALEGASVERLIYLSIVGSHEDAANACLASKGRAETICQSGPNLAGCVIRVPMVLGRGDYASFALRKRASSALAFTFRADSLEQPIYAGDVVEAVARAGINNVEGSYDLGGPEVLSRRALTERAAQILGTQHRLISLPVGVGMLFAGLLERLSADPPVTRAMLDVLDHDDNVDSQSALAALGMESLTALDDMLRIVFT